MTRSSAPRRDFAAMQERRRRAARLFAGGKRSQAEIARELQISRQSVSRWFEAWRQRLSVLSREVGEAARVFLGIGDLSTRWTSQYREQISGSTPGCSSVWMSRSRLFLGGLVSTRARPPLRRLLPVCLTRIPQAEPCAPVGKLLVFV